MRVMIIWVSVFVIYLLLVAMPPIWDTDFWWHLRVGEWITQHHQVPTVDLFSSIHPEREWKTFNWLFEVLIYGLHESVGLFGTRVFFALIVVVGFLLWFRYFRRETRNDSAAFMFLMLLLIMFADRLRIRPHLMNLPFEAMVALFLQAGGQLKTWRNRFLFFLTGILWSNFHNPCAALGAGIICLGSIIQITIQSRQEKEHITNYLWPAFLSILAIFCNPYGPSLLLSAKNNISPVYTALGEGEWQPPLSSLGIATDIFHMMNVFLPIISFLILMIFIVIKYLKKDSLLPPWLSRSAAPIGDLAISQTAMRFVYLCVPSLAWIVGLFNLDSIKARRVFTVISLLFFAIVYHNQITLRGGLKTTLSNLSINVWQNHNPDVAAQLIRETDLQGKIFTLPPAGSYLLWFAHPKGGVSSDGRSNMTLDVLQKQKIVGLNLGKDVSKILQVLDEMNMDIAVLPNGSFPFHHWPTNRWMRIAYDDQTEVFMRVGSVDVPKIRTWLKTTSSDPQVIQNLANQLWGDRYYDSKKARIQELQQSNQENDIHELAEIEHIAGHDNEALKILLQHLIAVPTCIRAATEITEILHDQGKYKEARKFLSPVTNQIELPGPTQELWAHLQHAHK